MKTKSNENNNTTKKTNTRFSCCSHLYSRVVYATGIVDRPGSGSPRRSDTLIPNSELSMSQKMVANCPICCVFWAKAQSNCRARYCTFGMCGLWLFSLPLPVPLASSIEGRRTVVVSPLRDCLRSGDYFYFLLKYISLQNRGFVLSDDIAFLHQLSATVFTGLLFVKAAKPWCFSISTMAMPTYFYLFSAFISYPAYLLGRYFLRLLRFQRTRLLSIPFLCCSFAGVSFVSLLLAYHVLILTATTRSLATTYIFLLTLQYTRHSRMPSFF